MSLSQVKYLFAHSSGSKSRSLSRSLVTRAIDEVNGESSSFRVVNGASSTSGNTTDCEECENDRRTPPPISKWNFNALLGGLRLHPNAHRDDTAVGFDREAIREISLSTSLVDEVPIRNGDIVIAAMGPTGSGKTTTWVTRAEVDRISFSGKTTTNQRWMRIDGGRHGESWGIEGLGVEGGDEEGGLSWGGEVVVGVWVTYPYHNDGDHDNLEGTPWRLNVELGTGELIQNQETMPDAIASTSRVRGNLSSIAYRVTEDKPLIPVVITLPICLEEESSTYILRRPWLPKRAENEADATWELLEQLEQPFNALLLQRLPHNQYRRVGSDRAVTACIQDLANIADSEILSLAII
ncbi:hypothetical protein BKA83DRAFT_4486599 [Pisolithus microcarpus]|nr:hypothetical protein BKA83DRAFT_4486599 [Pisolithus microcarpus]